MRATAKSVTRRRSDLDISPARVQQRSRPRHNPLRRPQLSETAREVERGGATKSGKKRSCAVVLEGIPSRSVFRFKGATAPKLLVLRKALSQYEQFGRVILPLE
eukprot:3747321-Rhodomonas_salina.1